jgi:glycosyltransferase involved in cell wall biosynthesis
VRNSLRNSKSVDRARPRGLRLAAVINWRDLGRWLWEYLPEGNYQADLIFAAPEPDEPRPKSLPPYLQEFRQLARRRPNLDQYDVVFAWEMRSALAVALWRRLTGQRRARWVVVAPILKGPLLRVAPLLRFLLRDVAKFICFNRAEVESAPRLLRLPSERFVFHPLAIWEDKLEAEPATDGGYLLALGHSNRDYLTLLRAIEGTNIPLTIVSAGPEWLEGHTAPTNVTLLYNTGFHETNRLVAGASFHVVPLADASFSSGQTVLLRAMACGKAVVITRSGGVEDYVQHEDSALLVAPGDADALRVAILQLWNDPAARERLGQRGQRLVREEYSLARLTRSLTELAEELMDVPQRAAQETNGYHNSSER